MLKFLGWKNSRGKWDKTEVIVDTGLVVAGILIIGVIIWLKQYI